MSTYSDIHHAIDQARGSPLEVRYRDVTVLVRRPTWAELLRGGKLDELVERHCMDADGCRLFGASELDTLPADLAVLLDEAIAQVYREAANPPRPCAPSSGSRGPSD